MGDRDGGGKTGRDVLFKNVNKFTVFCTHFHV